ncbi:Liprin-beta-2, partial [Anas platyrhynchos]
AAEYANGAYDIVSPAPSVYLGTFQILHLLEDLKMALEMLEDPQEKEALRNQIPGATAVCIREWFEENLVNHHSSTNNETYQERLARLEGDKESLILQVSVLTDQVEAQGEKIRDLEICLEGHQLKLNATEEMLQQELLSRTSLETQKLDLMAEVSDLKIKLVGMEKEQSEYEEKQNKAEGLLQELRHLKIKVEELENERNQYEWKLKATKGRSKMKIRENSKMCERRYRKRKKEKQREREKKKKIAQLQEQLALKDAEIERLQSQLSRTSSHSEVAERDQEVQRLKIGMESLLAANEEKVRKHHSFYIIKMKYFLFHLFSLSSAVEQAIGASDASSLLLLHSPSLPLLPVRSLPQDAVLPALILRGLSTGSSSSGTALTRLCPMVSIPQEQTAPAWVPHGWVAAPPMCPAPAWAPLHGLQLWPGACSCGGSPWAAASSRPHPPAPPGAPPRAAATPAAPNYQTLAHTPNTEQKAKVVTSRISGFLLLESARMSVSAPVLGETENVDGTVVSDDLSPLSSGTDSGPQSPLSPENRKSPKGIKKIWGKIRRTQSGNFPADDLGLAEFRRGGLRATAGPRLSRSKETKGQKSDYNAPFAQWSTERVCNWLEDFGLGQYVIFARQWVTSGHTLLTATPQDMEKEMGIKHPLHRKKLVLAIKSINAKQDEKSAQLDHIWVTRWLDDIGLPQYKDQFHESRVDGRMLQYLTVNDLLFLKVTSQLHHLSIKCAIHVLHVNSFNPHCLRRRPVEENNVSPSEVVQWSNHRVMEWLRSVDLAEYAPNLRGSGVHGGLIILEPRFNGDTLAMLLNIPPQKTLLRRHLTTNFNILIGPEAQQEKRDITESTAYTPLTTTAKVRPKKLGFSHFGNLRKKKFDESTDYICPMDTNPGATNGTQKNY